MTDWLRLEQLRVRNTVVGSGVPGVGIITTVPRSDEEAKLSPREVEELRDGLNDWLADRGR